MDIEQAATGYLKEYISRATYLRAIINDNDRGPILDGSIFIYNDKNYLNEKFVGLMPIQCKGKEVKTPKSGNTIKYPIKVSDLKAYLNLDGCMFFVICVTKKLNETKGYFISLKPLFIKALLDNKSSNKKTITVTLQEMPDNIETFTNIVRSTHSDCRIQRNRINRKTISSTDLKKLVQDGYEVVSNLMQNADNIDYEFLYNYKHDFYLKSPDGKEIISIENLNTILSVSKHMNIEIWVGDRKYYNEYEVVEDGENDIIHIGKSLKLFINKNKCSITVSFDFGGAILFSDRLRDMKFVVDMLNNKKIKFKTPNTDKSFELPLGKSSEKDNKIDIDGLNNNLKYLIDIDDAFKLLGLNIDEELHIKELSVTSEKNIRMLVDNLIYNKLYNQVIDGFSPLCIMDVGNISLLLYLEQRKNGVKVYNLASHKIDVVMRYKNGRADRKVSPYLSVSAKDIAKISNFDFEDIFQSFTSIGCSDDINSFIIELIKAFDICKKEKLLNIVERLSNWVIDNETNNELWNCVKLNQIQARFRISDANDEDLDYLNTVIYNDNYSTNLKLGACLLVKNKHKFELLFATLSNREKKIFKEYPIYKYFFPLSK